LGETPKLSGYLYPLLQALDEEYLKVDMQIGGTDQRKIFVLAREKLPQIGYKKRIELMNPLIPGLLGKKMSASVEASKISLMDSPKQIKKKVNGADFIEGDVDNGIMAFLKNIIFVLKKDKKEKLVIGRPEKFGGNLEFENYLDLEKAVLDKRIHPLDIKNSVSFEIISLLKGIEKKRVSLEKSFARAYPR